MFRYGNHPLFRFVLGWLLPPQMSFLKASHTPETREASIFKQVYQDISFPVCFGLGLILPSSSSRAFSQL